MASSFEVPAGGDQLFRTQLLAPEGQPSRAEAAPGEDVETRAAAAAAPAIWEKAPRRVVVAGSAVQADEAARRVARVVIRSIMVREGFCLILWGGGGRGGKMREEVERRPSEETTDARGASVAVVIASKYA